MDELVGAGALRTGPDRDGGKVHFRSGPDLAPLYPRFEEFRRLRRELDPEGRFLNDHLRSLFEPESLSENGEP